MRKDTELLGLDSGARMSNIDGCVEGLDLEQKSNPISTWEK